MLKNQQESPYESPWQWWPLSSTSQEEVEEAWRYHRKVAGSSLGPKMSKGFLEWWWVLSSGEMPCETCGWLMLVGGLVAFFIFPYIWEFHHPNWLTHIFQRGGPTTNYRWNVVIECDRSNGSMLLNGHLFLSMMVVNGDGNQCAYDTMRINHVSPGNPPTKHDFEWTYFTYREQNSTKPWGIFQPVPEHL